jgi:hypothetical protein
MATAVQFHSRKGELFVSDPSTYWLTLTNVALGIVVLICCLAVGIGVFQELAARHKKRVESAELDREVADLIASFQDGHVFHSPELGITMADGGEEFKKKEER